MVKEEGVEHDQRRLLGIEAADIERRRIRGVVDRRIIVGRHEIDVRHHSRDRALRGGDEGAGSAD